MESDTKHSRRKMLKAGMTVLAVIPLVGVFRQASAAQNTAIRTALKFQGTPNGDKQCSKCINFIPNKDKPDNQETINGCKLYPGDTEITPNGYCNGFVKKPV